MQYFVKQMNTINRYCWDDLYFAYFWYDTNYVYWLYWQLSAIFPASWVWNETVSYNPAIVLPNDLSLLTTFVISPHRTTIKIFYQNKKYFIKPKNGKFTSLIHVNSQLLFLSWLSFYCFIFSTVSGQLSGCACLCGAVSRPDPIHCYQSPEYRFSADISLHTFNQTRRKYIPSPLYNWTMLFTPTCSALKRFVRRGPNYWPAVAWPRSLGSHLVRHQYSILFFCHVYQYFWGAEL